MAALRSMIRPSPRLGSALGGCETAVPTSCQAEQPRLLLQGRALAPCPSLPCSNQCPPLFHSFLGTHEGGGAWPTRADAAAAVDAALGPVYSSPLPSPLGVPPAQGADVCESDPDPAFYCPAPVLDLFVQGLSSCGESGQDMARECKGKVPCCPYPHVCSSCFIICLCVYPSFSTRISGEVSCASLQIGVETHSLCACPPHTHTLCSPAGSLSFPWLSGSVSLCLCVHPSDYPLSLPGPHSVLHFLFLWLIAPLHWG